MGKLYRFECWCGGHGMPDDQEKELAPDDFRGCGLVSHGALLEHVTVDEYRLVMGWFRGDPDAPEGQFCPYNRGLPNFTGKDSGDEVERAVMVSPKSVVPVEETSDGG